MPITQHALVKPGAAVSIVLKADQRTGRQIQGTVAQLLTRHNHPRGIKVKLTDGRVGRVQQLLPLDQSRTHRATMESNSNNNPWASEQSQNREGAAQSYYQTQPQSQQQQYHQQQPQSIPARNNNRTDMDQFLGQQGDRAEQVEQMQQYEAMAPQSEDDRNQAQLQKEFPNIDGSLIAAIYMERKGQSSLAEVREMLQELNSS